MKDRIDRLAARFYLSLKKKSSFWTKEQQEYTLGLFRDCLKRVPAYKTFLASHKIQANKIKTYQDLLPVPPVGKDTYLRKYSLEKLCQDATLAKQSLVLTSTSGSTGSPFYFPRNAKLDFQSSLSHEIFLRNSQIEKDKSTLILICFGMGVWIGGVITYEAFKEISLRGYNLSIITPGVNKKEIYEAMRNLAPHYDQVIICGYPPFMKDVIDEGPSNGIDWRKHELRMIFAAESFSENFRDHILALTGMKDPLRDTMNIYGSADLGTMATETPLSIFIRRIALANSKIYKKLFPFANRLPTLAQFNPLFINFEAFNTRIFCTGDNIIPLVRYEIGDNGGVLTFDEVGKIFESEGLDLQSEIRKAGIADTIMELPFVFVYERTDLSTKLYGAIIYPEHVKSGLERALHLHKHITGKFTMFTKTDKQHNEYLEVNIELKPDIKATRELKNRVVQAIVEGLREKSAEYSYLISALNTKVMPKIIFWTNGHRLYFPLGIKQKWVKHIK